MKKELDLRSDNADMQNLKFLIINSRNGGHKKNDYYTSF